MLILITTLVKSHKIFKNINNTNKQGDGINTAYVELNKYPSNSIGSNIYPDKKDDDIFNNNRDSVDKRNPVARQEQRLMCFERLVVIYTKYKYISSYFIPDSVYQVYKLLLSKSLVLGVRYITLLTTSGLAIDFLFIHEFGMSLHIWYVRIFTIIVSIHFIGLGILWLIYLIFNKKCHGANFLAIFYNFDNLINIIYSFLPLTLYSKENNIISSAFLFDLKTLGNLRSENRILFASAFISMTFTLKTFYSVLHNLGDEMKNENENDEQFSNFSNRMSIHSTSNDSNYDYNYDDSVSRKSSWISTNSYVPHINAFFRQV